ncbi:Ankyrin-1 like protein [Argiope bruennichi]|uniref:Ankyrin-1 like protein n=1 Tax=Argiope bruennichi TaxID=94029 RepID=A0A8T0ESS1_ARGBR|nr:Ankyrin-1 like protein [Argiope bruennichi]
MGFKSTTISQLSTETYELLLSFLPDNIKEVITKLRDDLSHEECLFVRYGIEMSEQNVFQRIQSDITEMNLAVSDIILRKKTMIFDNEEYSQVLETCMLDFQERFQSLALPQLSKKFSDMFQKITSELVRENFARGIPFLTALSKIHIFLEFRLGKTKWIKEFKQILQNQEENKLQKSLQKIPKSKKLKPLLSDKLSLLEQIVKEYHENKQFFQKSQCSQKKLKLLSIIEMLTLDSFSILGCKSLPNRLTHNAFFLDKYYPVINGKNLRNHLAHGNALVSIVLEDECADILLNAEKMTTYDLLKSKQEIGKKVKNDPQMIKTCLDTDLSTVSQQLKLFAALSEGKKEKVKDYISKGADVFGRDMRSQTSLHFAAKGPCLATVKFLLKFNLDVYAVDFNLQTALHVASSNGRLATTSSGMLRFIIAIIHNHLTIASILLEKIVDANKTFFGDTALHLASGKGHMNLVITLLDKISVNFRSDLKFTPLHYAARGGHADVVQLLISKGAEVDAKTLKGATPLHLAAEKGHNTVVEILLQYGADINATDFNGFTALCFAVKGGFLATSKFLLEREMVADSVKNYIWDPLDFVVEIRRYFLRISKPLLGKDKIADGIKNSSYKPLILAAQFDHYELVEILLHRCNTSSKLSALHWAALKGHLRIVELLINNEINAECDDSGCTALHLAAYEGHTEIVNFLISKGYIKRINSKIVRNELDKNSNCEVQDAAVLFINGTNDFDDVLEFSGTTALHLSAFRKHKDIVRCLLKNQADIYIKDDIGTTPLQAIIVNGMADILIDESISINFTDCGDSSPLMLGTSQGDLMFVEYCIGKGIHKGCVEDAKNKALAVAVYFGHEDVMNCLIKHGACVNASSPDGFTPLDLAVEAKRWNIVRVLIDDKKAEMSVQKERKYLLSAIKSGHEDIVEYFLARHPENGASRLECREFPLHTAVQYGHLNIVKKLLELEKRTDINDTNENFATPLQLASGQGYSEITRLLILNGADPNVPDHNPPLHLAVANSDYEMIEVLIEAGANATLGDEDGISAIGLAIKCKSLDVMETLLELSEIDINFKGDNDRTFLHDAAVSGSLQIIKSLIEKGAAIDARDSTGVKPIHMAAKEGYQDIVEYFLGEGINVGDIGENGWCLLHYAAAGNQTEICEFLLRNGLNVNTVDAHGCSPLHIAAQLGKTEVFHILLRYGAYYDFLNERNETPLNVAMASSSTNNFPIIASLIFITSLYSAVEKKDLRKVRASLNELLRLSKINYIDIKNAENISLLNYAEQKGCAEIVDFLLKCSVDGNDRPSNLSIIKSILKELLRKN